MNISSAIFSFNPASVAAAVALGLVTLGGLLLAVLLTTSHGAGRVLVTIE